MTVKELKKKLNKYDDNLKIGGSNYFGEYLKIEDIYKNKENNFIVLSIEKTDDDPY